MTEETYPVNLIKMELYIVNFHGMEDATKEDWETEIDASLNRVAMTSFVKIGDLEKRIVDWHDGIDINKLDATKEHFEKYFTQEKGQ